MVAGAWDARALLHMRAAVSPEPAVVRVALLCVWDMGLEGTGVSGAAVPRMPHASVFTSAA